MLPWNVNSAETETNKSRLCLSIELAQQHSEVNKSRCYRHYLASSLFALNFVTVSNRHQPCPHPPVTMCTTFPPTMMAYWKRIDQTPCDDIRGLSHTRTVVRECCKGDDASQWENGKFDPLPRPNPSTNRHKKLHT